MWPVITSCTIIIFLYLFSQCIIFHFSFNSLHGHWEIQRGFYDCLLDVSNILFFTYYCITLLIMEPRILFFIEPRGWVVKDTPIIASDRIGQRDNPPIAMLTEIALTFFLQFFIVFSYHCFSLHFLSFLCNFVRLCVALIISFRCIFSVSLRLPFSQDCKEWKFIIC